MHRLSQLCYGVSFRSAQIRLRRKNASFIRPVAASASDSKAFCEISAFIFAVVPASWSNLSSIGIPRRIFSFAFHASIKWCIWHLQCNCGYWKGKNKGENLFPADSRGNLRKPQNQGVWLRRKRSLHIGKWVFRLMYGGSVTQSLRFSEAACRWCSRRTEPIERFLNVSSYEMKPCRG